MWNIRSVALVIGYLVTLVLIRWVLLTKKRHPAATIAWMLAIVLLPYVGGVLFLFFGINRVKRRALRKRAAKRNLAARLPPLPQADHTPSAMPLNDQQARLLRLTRHSCGSQLTCGNLIELISDTNRTLRLIEEAIEGAQESIHLEYYIWRADRTGRKLRDLLVAKAKSGVAIRFLYDGIGSFWLNRRFLRPMCDAGICTATFIPGQKFRERWSFNLRNHRKIVIADGRVGFTGGMNIGDEYLGRNRRLGYWRDLHLRLEGPTVLQLQQIFAEDWYYATGEELTQPQKFPRPRADGDVCAQVVSGGPDGDTRTFHQLMFAAINEAERQITLTTSYFVPTDALMVALETAAARGVKVRLMLSGRSDFPITVLAARSYYESLLQWGVEIYEYQKGIMHSKALTIDGHWSLVGSPNFDPRSLLLNFEVGVAMYDEGIAAHLEKLFEQDREAAGRIELDQWNRRKTRDILKENVARLFSPVL